MIYLAEYRLKRVQDGYPFIPLIVNTERFTFNAGVTVICGDNGSGKSTFAKILSAACNCVRVSYKQMQDDEFVARTECFAVSKRFSPKRSFYFSAEEFIQFVRDVEERKRDALCAIAEIDADKTLSDYAKSLAKQPHVDTLVSFENFYGKSLAEVSHGQGFLKFFDKRLKENGLYIIDEPEAALSAENQFLLSVRIKNAAENMNCQFVVFTHSPVIASIPQADVYEIQNDAFVKTDWDGLSDVKFLQMFFKNKDRLF